MVVSNLSNTKSSYEDKDNLPRCSSHDKQDLEQTDDHNIVIDCSINSFNYWIIKTFQNSMKKQLTLREISESAYCNNLIRFPKSTSLDRKMCIEKFYIRSMEIMSKQKKILWELDSKYKFIFINEPSSVPFEDNNHEANVINSENIG